MPSSSHLQPATLKFLKDLRKNNNKPWFDAHRNQYDSAKADFQQFIQQVIQGHGKKDPTIAGLEAKQCLFRINRDIRFSKDKSPYKTNMGAYMSKGGKKSPLGGYYFHCEPGSAFTGGGMWQPDGPLIKKVRQEIDYNWNEFRKIIGHRQFKSIYGDLYRGDDVSLSKTPQGYDPSHPAAPYLKLKSWIAMANLSDAELSSPGLLKKTLAALSALQPLVEFLNQAAEDPEV